MARLDCLARRTLVALSCAAAVAIPGVALAQQKYKLTEEDQWSAETPPDPASPEGQLAEARKALAANEPERAETLASNWIERNPRSQLLADAYMIRGDAKAAGGDEYKALFDYEYVARMFPGSEAFVTALQRELAIAKEYIAGMKRKQWGLRLWDAKSDGEEILIRVQERLPGSKLAEDAGITLADYYFENRQMELSAEAYDLFILNYPHSPLVDKARRRLIYSYLATFKGPGFSATGLYEARERLRQLRATMPAEAERMGATALLTRIDESDAQKMLTTAEYYLSTGDVISAEFTIRRLVKRYPRSVATAEALRMIPAILPQLPERVRQAAPDYAAMAAALLDQPERTQPQRPAPTQPPAAGSAGQEGPSGTPPADDASEDSPPRGAR